MPAVIATVLCAIGIWFLFRLDREMESRTSVALWLPVGWLWIAGSRAVSRWMLVLGMGSVSSLKSANVEGSPADQFVLFSLLFLGLLVLFQRWSQVSALIRANLLLVAYFLLCILSIFWSDFTDIALRRWIRAFGDLVMVLVVLSEENRSAALKKLFSRVAFILIPMSVLFVRYFPAWGTDYTESAGLMYTGVTTQKNELGLVCLFFGLASIWRFLAAFQEPRGYVGRVQRLFAHGLVVVMAVWLLHLSNSVTSSVCLLLGATLLVWLRVSRTAQSAALVYSVLAAALLIPTVTLFLAKSFTSLSAVGRDTTLTGRTHIWDVALQVSANPWVGAGFQSFWLGPRLQKISHILNWHATSAHNGYLETYLELGWAGVFLLGLILLKGLRDLVTTFFLERELGSLLLVLAVMALVSGITESVFRLMNVPWIVLLLAIVLAGRTRIDSVGARLRKGTQP